jgi:hypothetical protein
VVDPGVLVNVNTPGDFWSVCGRLSVVLRRKALGDVA